MQLSSPEARLSAPDCADPSDLASCSALLRGGSRSFFAASLFLPRDVCRSAAALYAFCRLADDAVDLEGGGLIALARLADRLDRVYAGRPLPLPQDRALADVVRHVGLPRALPSALLEGFAWDAAGRRYEELSDLYAYAARVAGAVGAMMAMLMDAREPAVVARACDLGVAMQLSNIARDVGEDARSGRLYLPMQWMRDAGMDPDDWLARPVFSVALQTVIGRVLRAADVLYDRAEAGIAQLPPRCRPGIRAAHLLYREIGREVERRGNNSVSTRAVVAPRRKMLLLGQAFVASPLRDEMLLAPALKEVQFLVAAVAAAPLPMTQRPVARLRPPDLGERLAWLVDLFNRLEQREQLGRTRA